MRRFWKKLQENWHRRGSQRKKRYAEKHISARRDSAGAPTEKSRDGSAGGF
jgi:hypothetical protein